MPHLIFPFNHFHFKFTQSYHEQEKHISSKQLLDVRMSFALLLIPRRQIKADWIKDCSSQLATERRAYIGSLSSVIRGFSLI